MKIRLKYILLILGIFSTSLIIFKKFSSNFIFLGRYKVYFINHIQSSGGKTFYLMLLLTIILLILYKKIIKISKNNEKLLQITLTGSIFYLNIYLLGDLASRITIYFFIFIFYILEDIFYILEDMFSPFVNKNVIKIIFIFSCFILLNISLYIDIKNTNALVPYKNFFQKEREIKIE